MMTSTNTAPGAAVAWTITDLESRTAHSYLAGDKPGTYARVELTNGDVLELSRLVGESDWTADASWGKGSFPRWCNGFGARYLITKVVTDADLVSALNSCAARMTP